MHDGDAECGCFARAAHDDRLAVEKDLAGVGLLYAGEDAHERGFACAVLADQHVDGIAAYAEVDVIERSQAGILLDDVACFEDEVFIHARACAMACCHAA